MQGEGMGVCYATREDVKSALDSKESARNNAQIDRLLDASSRAIEGLTHRRFYPEVDTRAFPWPTSQTSNPWRYWLDANELIAVTTVTSGGTTIAATDYFLEPQDPPYNRLEIDLASSAAFGGGATHQRDLVITGVFGYNADEQAAGTLAEALDTSETSVDVTNSAAIGVGSLIRVGSERMLVTGKSMVTTGQLLQTPLTAQMNAETVAVTNGAAFAVDEVILLDSERMLIVDIAGNNLTVKRSWDGSTLAAHTASTIYAPRTLTVTRGALGTTAASHSDGASIAVHVVPSLVRQLCIAETVNALHQESSGYARAIGAGDNVREVGARGLKDLRQQVYARYGRKVRTRVV